MAGFNGKWIKNLETKQAEKIRLLIIDEYYNEYDKYGVGYITSIINKKKPIQNKEYTKLGWYAKRIKKEKENPEFLKLSDVELMLGIGWVVEGKDISKLEI